MTPKTPVFVGFASALLALDQITKYLVRQQIPVNGGEIVVIPSFLSITHASNKGAAFSALDSFAYRMPLFYAFTAVAVFVLVQGYRQLPGGDRFQAAAMGMILSGALGNFTDRVIAGEVTDMVKVYAGFEPLRSWAIAHFRTNVYPIWNVADAAIVVGVLMFGVTYWIEWRQARLAPPPTPTE